jgi:hypothetical protein
MFKGFQDTSRSPMFRGFPNLNFRMNNSAHGFTGCYFWLDAAINLSTNTNGANITYWQSIYGNYRFEQGTAASQPLYVLNDVNYNNFPTISTSTNRFLQLTTRSNTFFLDSNKTFAIVANYDTINVGNIILGTSTGGLGCILWGGSNAAYLGIGIRENGGTFWQTTVDNTTPHIAIFTINDIVVDGASSLSSSSNVILPNISLNQLGIGINGASSVGFNGKIAEVVAWDFKMTQSQMIQLSNNINEKYAIY